jgi:hypothetical protein
MRRQQQHLAGLDSFKTWDSNSLSSRLRCTDAKHHLLLLPRSLLPYHKHHTLAHLFLLPHSLLLYPKLPSLLTIWLPASCSLFLLPVPCSLLPVPWLPAPCSLLPAPLPQTPYSPYSLAPSFRFLLLAPCSLIPSSLVFLLPRPLAHNAPSSCYFLAYCSLPCSLSLLPHRSLTQQPLSPLLHRSLAVCVFMVLLWVT